LFLSVCLAFAVNAAIDVVFLVNKLEYVGEFLFDSGDAAGIGALVNACYYLGAGISVNSLSGVEQQLVDESHAHIFCVSDLLEVAGSGVIVNSYADLVYSGQRMKDAHIAPIGYELPRMKDATVLQSKMLVKSYCPRRQYSR